MSLTAVRCLGCGGAVRARPDQPLPHCLFCGRDARDLLPFDPPETLEQPEAALPFAIESETAQRAFQAFARSDIWYPSDLRNATLSLRKLLVPAWSFTGRIETHWTALVSGASESGKTPIAGEEVVDFAQVLVPASKTLTVIEMAALGLYDEQLLSPFKPERADAPYELTEVSRSAARQAALGEMERRHQQSLARRHDTIRLCTSSLSDTLVGRPVLVPVWVGAYRYGDTVYRILVNGQTGRLYGTAPQSWLKMLAVILGLFITFVVLFLALAMVSM